MEAKKVVAVSSRQSEPDSAPGPKDRKIEAGDKNKYF